MKKISLFLLLFFLLLIGAAIGVAADEVSPAHTHDYVATVTRPTCTEAGYTTHTCTSCGDSYRDNFVSATGHTPGPIATCSSDQICTVCGQVLTERLEHNYIARTTAPTCTTEGYITYTCARCGDSYTEITMEAKGHVPGEAATCTTSQNCTVCTAILVPALGHHIITEERNPTCTEKGGTFHRCTRCGEERVEHTIPAAGHSPSEWIVDRPSTAESEGSKHIECTVCGEILNTAIFVDVSPETTPEETEKDMNLVGNILVGILVVAALILAWCLDPHRRRRLQKSFQEFRRDRERFLAQQEMEEAAEREDDESEIDTDW